jgi:hypothetical protein
MISEVFVPKTEEVSNHLIEDLERIYAIYQLKNPVKGP